jgi:hypothetical protein
MKKLLCVLPYFQGFYESIHLDRSDLESDLENCNNEELKKYYEKEFIEYTEQYSEEVKKELIPTFKDFLAKWGNYDVYNGLPYEEATNEVAKNCMDELEGIIKEALKDLNIDLGEFSFEFEKVESPKYYNFCTDRVFFHIAIHDENKFINAVKAISSFPKLNEIVLRSFTSYDGFYSHYSNDVLDWIDSINNRPLELDHNELETLLKAIIETYINTRDIEDFIGNLYTEASCF